MARRQRWVRAGDEPHEWWVFDRRVIWSAYWWLAVVLFGIALLFWLVIPVDRGSGDTSLPCGTVLSTTSTDGLDGDAEEAAEYIEEECEKVRDAQSSRAFAFFVAGLLPVWLGLRDINRGDVRREHLAASVCVGISLMLLIGPHESSKEAICGSPLWAEVAESDSSDDDNDVAAESCLVERPSRVAWAVLWGVAAVPLAMGASRGRREDDE